MHITAGSAAIPVISTLLARRARTASAVVLQIPACAAVFVAEVYFLPVATANVVPEVGAAVLANANISVMTQPIVAHAVTPAHLPKCVSMEYA